MERRKWQEQQDRILAQRLQDELIPGRSRNSVADPTSPSATQLEADMLLAQSLQQEEMAGGSPHNFHGPVGDMKTCARCHASIRGTYLHALGGFYHQDCFKCTACGSSLDARFFLHEDEPYHQHCYEQLYVPTCCLCGSKLVNRRIVTNAHGQSLCAEHQDDRLRPCDGCGRIKERGQEFVPLPDGRHICGVCSATALFDTTEAQPLICELKHFFRTSLGLPLPDTLPVYLVATDVLNAQVPSSNHPTTGSHVLGLCMSEVTTVTHVEHRRRPDLFGIGDLLPRQVRVEAHASVPAILCVYGLPREHTGSVLAHEFMHAALRLSSTLGSRHHQDHLDSHQLLHIDPVVEEGLCNLASYIYLTRYQEGRVGTTGSGGARGGSSSSSGVAASLGTGPGAPATFVDLNQPGRGGYVPPSGPPPGPTPSTDGQEQLRKVLITQLERNLDHVYGEGFRRAVTSYLKHGFHACVEHIKLTGQFPE